MMYVVTQYCSEFDGANHFICTLDGGQIDLESARAAFAAYLKPLVDEFCAKMSEMRALYKAVLDRYSEERSRAAIAHGELTGLPFTGDVLDAWLREHPYPVITQQPKPVPSFHEYLISHFGFTVVELTQIEL